MSSELHQTAMQTKNDPLAFIKQKSLFGNLAEHKQFASLYTEMILQIYKDGDVKKLMKNMIVGIWPTLYSSRKWKLYAYDQILSKKTSKPSYGK